MTNGTERTTPDTTHIRPFRFVDDPLAPMQRIREIRRERTQRHQRHAYHELSSSDDDSEQPPRNVAARAAAKRRNSSPVWANGTAVSRKRRRSSPEAVVVDSSDDDDDDGDRKKERRDASVEGGGSSDFEEQPRAARTAPNKRQRLSFMFMEEQKEGQEEGTDSNHSSGSRDGNDKDLQPSRTTAGTSLAAGLNSSSKLIANRTRVCGKDYGRCELVFDHQKLEMMLWKQALPKQTAERAWNGDVQFDHIERLGLFEDSRSYLFLVEFRRGASFGDLYDPICAKVIKEHGSVPEPNLFGVAFYFEDQFDYVRCQSLLDSRPALASLLHDSFPEEIATAFYESKVASARVTRTLRQRSLFEGTTGGVVTRRRSLALVSIDEDEKQEASNSKAVIPIFSQDDKEDTDQSTTFQKNVAGRKASVLLNYPYEDPEAVGRITITAGDVDRLTPGEFLNDTIIDFYLRFLYRHLGVDQQHEVYFFSSHFFTKLYDSSSTAEERFGRVHRWTQKESDFFDKRFVFVPINDSFHWSVAVICNPGSAIIRQRRRLKHEESPHLATVDLVDDGTDSSKEQAVEEEVAAYKNERLQRPPCILFLDSLKCHRKNKFCAVIKSYLESEWNYRQSQLSSADGNDIITTFDPSAITVFDPDIPQQTNSSDCGVFLLMYAAEILRRFPAGITADHIADKFMSSLSSGIFKSDHVREFRDYVRQLIYCLRRLHEWGLSESSVKNEGLEEFTIC
ncbi:TPA: hypothetical protein N0F65_007553 [Lagenidium giganteum]|uniref:Ubiquitin-like protease family profile domain-containing protein n=1 Tax=Lagenidium giganteum TaxID=4803 RepID=A0AAV2ZHT5_9STRA|nr:TPA: hypothetical protein N0F65_007553 [Lagenidium giganteum]